MKICTKCKVIKNSTEFHKDNRAKSGLQSRCKECHKNDRQDPEYYREYWLRSKYGIGLEEYDRLREEQGYSCRICEIHEKHCENSKLVVDHNHETEEVRGLLCKKCNQALGLLQDNPDNCIAAAEYLKEEGHYGRS